MTEVEILHLSAVPMALFSIVFWREAFRSEKKKAIGAPRSWSRLSAGAFAATFDAGALAAWYQPPPLPSLVLFLVFATFSVACVRVAVDIRRGKSRNDSAA